VPSVRLPSLPTRVRVATRAAAFWTAVALPVSALCLLAAGADLALVGGLLVCNAVALIVGHDHRASPRPNRDH